MFFSHYLGMETPPKTPLQTKFFNVNIVFLILGTLKGKKNAKKLRDTGGTQAALLAHGLKQYVNTIRVIHFDFSE